MSNDGRSFAPSFQLARLFRKTSQKGATYFAGRIGGARVTLLKSRETAEDGGEIWSLMIAEAPKQDQRGPSNEARRETQRPASPQRQAPTSDMPDEEIPL